MRKPCVRFAHGFSAFARVFLRAVSENSRALVQNTYIYYFKYIQVKRLNIVYSTIVILVEVEEDGSV